MERVSTFSEAMNAAENFFDDMIKDFTKEIDELKETIQTLEQEKEELEEKIESLTEQLNGTSYND